MYKGHSSSRIPIVVVMAAYNGVQYLSEQLESVLHQSMKPGVVRISDDRSTDNTLGVLDKYTTPGLIQVTVNDRNLGVIGNFRSAVGRVTEPAYIALADQDDIWQPQKLEVLYSRLTDLDDGECPAMVYSDLTVIDRNGTVLNPSFWNELGQDGYRHCLQTLLYGNFVTGCTIMMNSRMAGYLRAMPDDVPMHDHWLALVAFSFGKVDAVSEPLVNYRKHGTNVAHSENFKKETAFQRRLNQLKALLSGDDHYLQPELSIAAKFYELHGDKLNADQRLVFERFLGLKEKSFLQKKLAFKRAFKPYWK